MTTGYPSAAARRETAQQQLLRDIIKQRALKDQLNPRKHSVYGCHSRLLGQEDYLKANNKRLEQRHAKNRSAMWSHIAARLANGSTLEKVFKEIDSDGNGTLSLKELKRAFNKMGMNISKQETAGFMASCDTNGDGELDLAELKAFFAKQSKQQANVSQTRNINFMRAPKPKVVQKAETRSIIRPELLALQPNHIKSTVKLQEMMISHGLRARDLTTCITFDHNGIDKHIAVPWPVFMRKCFALGWDVTFEEADACRAYLDTNGDGDIGFDELQKGITKARRMLNICSRPASFDPYERFAHNKLHHVEPDPADGCVNRLRLPRSKSNPDEMVWMLKACPRKQQLREKQKLEKKIRRVELQLERDSIKEKLGKISLKMADTGTRTRNLAWSSVE
jgi:hypothetical protein